MTFDCQPGEILSCKYIDAMVVNPATILGVMSGTSLDGLDFALCNFKKENNKFNYSVIKAAFYEYDSEIKKSLLTAQKLNAFEFVKFHKNYGKYIGQKINDFLKNEIKPDFIASHGHTIFHRPEEQISFQIGDGAFIAAETKIPVISDFRNLDTALGGQGAPLVPAGDKMLFSDFEYCINLGGFANISFDNEKTKRTAFDICPFNFLINRSTLKIGKEFDENGKIGKSGKISKQLLNELNSIEYYRKKPPKSLGREYAEKYFIPVIDKYKIPEKDIIRTLYEHFAVKISEALINNKAKTLVTGGGTHNVFFISLLKQKTKSKIIIPDKKTIDFKEAIIFAFLGFLRINKLSNTFCSVTGAEKDSSGGSVVLC